MKKLSKGIIVICSICLLVNSLMLFGCQKENWDMKYSIVNYAGMQDTSGGGLSYAQTFVVKGTIVLENYTSSKVIITADAVDAYDRETKIFTVIDYNGNGTYDFYMDSFYRYDAKIVKIINVTVKNA